MQTTNPDNASASVSCGRGWTISTDAAAGAGMAAARNGVEGLANFAAGIAGGAAEDYGITKAAMRKGIFADVAAADNSITVCINDRLGANDPPQRVMDSTPKAMGALGNVPYTASLEGALEPGILKSVTVTFFGRW